MSTVIAVSDATIQAIAVAMNTGFLVLLTVFNRKTHKVAAEARDNSEAAAIQTARVARIAKESHNSLMDTLEGERKTEDAVHPTTRKFPKRRTDPPGLE